ncbi:hypothetical protein [Sphingomonas sp. 10B4]|uniref:hypothetical protein n=1 Tax=Sphingomonas sp. 10B4 TaxID=3048575 RepID=UPI002AB38503|nr:hypothetical protein [Sphingomonas sp. 10B4]MDY7525481.1 hypothetical protein [Sphingomonas sp. 10B4]MEB0281425.1 hypothetical protein [Sphingomonas sp. 10B4]
MPDINAHPTSRARSPRGAVKINGTLVDAWISLEVDNNAFRAADTFRVEFAAYDLPAVTSIAWFSTQTSIEVELFATEDWTGTGAYYPAASDRLILGQTDDIEFDPLAGTLSVSGRDLTATLIDTKTNEGFLNKTASQIVAILAGRHGLSPIATATTALVGTYYTQNHISQTQERSEWDILVELAEFEDFDVFVTARELHFQPKPKDSGNRYAIVYRLPGIDPVPSSNVSTVRFDRSLTIAKGVVVTVRSWNAKQKKGFEASWPKSPKATKPGQSGAADPIKYHYSIAGLTQDQAQQRAQRYYDQITKHMVTMSADLPADDLMSCSLVVQVRGTGTAWDQDYYPDSVKRSMSHDEGYRMTVTAKNISADVEAQS